MLRSELIWEAFQRLPEPLMVADERRRICFINQAAATLLGCARDEASGRGIGVALSALGADVGEQLASLVDSVLRGGVNQAERREFVVDGGDAWRGVLEVHVEAFSPDRDAQSRGVMVLFRDVTAQWSRTHELHYQATHDALTGLINRREFEQRLIDFSQHFERTGVRHALCFIDLNRFKAVNDEHGHGTGDRLLSELSRFMQGQLRKGDVLGRLGGDEFGLILPACSGREAVQVARSIQRTIASFRFEHGNTSFSIAASIGVTDICDAGLLMQELIDAADMACYAAKQSGASAGEAVVHSAELEAVTGLRHSRLHLTSH
jgi:diguanylate cyclase (GGDEF)-like protein/PAS domain S-box-containing protein